MEETPQLQPLEPENKGKIPVSIITGFLGAGKTTFLNYVLTSHEHKKKIAVIQNEFGDRIGLEEAMLSLGSEKTTSSLQQWVELPNGCLCCSVKDDFVVALESLMKKKGSFDYIFIECDGLADPGTVASVFWLDEALESEIYLDSIIALVDAKHILKNLNEKKPKGAINEAQRQIALADRIVINKKDLVSPIELEKVTNRIREVNPFSPIIQSEMAIVPLSQMLGINAYSVKEPILDLQEFHEEKHNHSHHEEEHDESVSTITIESSVPIALDVFNTWLGNLLWGESSELQIYRCKGVLSIENSNEKHSLQGVHSLFSVEPSGIIWKDDEKRISKIVIIGKGVDYDELKASFDTQVINKKS